MWTTYVYNDVILCNHFDKVCRYKCMDSAGYLGLERPCRDLDTTHVRIGYRKVINSLLAFTLHMSGRTKLLANLRPTIDKKGR